MTKIERTFDLPARPENVFAEVSDPARWPRWCDFVKSASPSGPRAHWVYNLGGMKVESDTEVTERRENAVYAFRQTQGFLKSGTTRLELAPTKAGSQVTWTLEYELPYSYLGKLVDKLKAKKQFEGAVDASIRNLGKLLGS